MIERNQANSGLWAEAVATNVQNLSGTDSYNRLSVFQPATHPVVPWTSLLFGIFSVSIWYNVLNQFMIQRVLGAKNIYHARMGIVMAGFMKILLPGIVVVPGLILFAMRPEILLQPWDAVKPAADKGYVSLLQTLVPAGLRGLFLAALFGAIQSTVNSVLNSTATVFTLDIYRRLLKPNASDKHLVWVGVVSSVVVLAVAILLGCFIGELGESLFVYIQSLYAFFAPPFAAVFLLGILWQPDQRHGRHGRRHAGLRAGNRHEGLRAVRRGLAGLGPAGVDRALRQPGGRQLGLLHGRLHGGQPPDRAAPARADHRRSDRQLAQAQHLRQPRRPLVHQRRHLVADLRPRDPRPPRDVLRPGLPATVIGRHACRIFLEFPRVKRSHLRAAVVNEVDDADHAGFFNPAYGLPIGELAGSLSTTSVDMAPSTLDRPGTAGQASSGTRRRGAHRDA